MTPKRESGERSSLGSMKMPEAPETDKSTVQADLGILAMMDHVVLSMMVSISL